MGLRCRICKGFNMVFSDAKKSWDEGSVSVCLNVQCHDCDWECYYMMNVDDVIDPEERI